MRVGGAMTIGHNMTKGKVKDIAAVSYHCQVKAGDRRTATHKTQMRTKNRGKNEARKQRSVAL